MVSPIGGQGCPEGALFSESHTKSNITKQVLTKNAQTIINKNDKVLFLFIQIIFFNNNILFEILSNI